MKLLSALCSIDFIRQLIRRNYYPGESNKTRVFGLIFKNPVGLGAGFDKNAQYLTAIETLGFGFIEIGTVTPRPQRGNPKPRLFRLTEDQAFINRMGFNNDGVDKIAKQLKKWKLKSKKRMLSEETKMLVGGNIGKNKDTPNEEAWKDYEICFRALYPYVDFFVINVSSPNTPGLRALQEKEALNNILCKLQDLNKESISHKPILLKIAPDLSVSQIDEIITLSLDRKLEGIVATNTTIERTGLLSDLTKNDIAVSGGLSGKPLQKRSTEVIECIHRKTKGRISIIASGGISDAESANEKFSSGADLVEVWTGFIYEGPSIVRRIVKNMIKKPGIF